MIPLNKRADFLVQGTLCFGGNFSTSVDERWGFGFNYKIQKCIAVNELYFHRESKIPNGQTGERRAPECGHDDHRAGR